LVEPTGANLERAKHTFHIRCNPLHFQIDYSDHSNITLQVCDLTKEMETYIMGKEFAQVYKLTEETVIDSSSPLKSNIKKMEKIISNIEEKQQLELDKSSQFEENEDLNDENLRFRPLTLEEKITASKIFSRYVKRYF
jgi:hypothetical protein